MGALACSLLGGIDRFWSLEAVCFLALVSSVIVFPCCFVTSGLMFQLFPDLGKAATIRNAWMAGFFTAGLLLFSICGGFYQLLFAWAPTGLLDGSPFEKFLMVLTPFSLAVSAGLLLSWIRSCWRGPRVRSGGGRETILPPGDRK